MAKKRPKFDVKGFIGGTQSSILTETVSVPFLEKHVRFSLRDCNIKDFCVRNLSDQEIEKFYKRLGHFEGHTWRQAIQLPHDNGFSLEKKDSDNYSLLSGMYSQFTQFYHFRVYGLRTPFRVFGGQKDDLCYVLLVDKDGSMNHS